MDDFEKELAALKALIEALIPLDDAARQRIINYVRDRFGREK